MSKSTTILSPFKEQTTLGFTIADAKVRPPRSSKDTKVRPPLYSRYSTPMIVDEDKFREQFNASLDVYIQESDIKLNDSNPLRSLGCMMMTMLVQYVPYGKANEHQLDMEELGKDACWCCSMNSSTGEVTAISSFIVIVEGYISGDTGFELPLSKSAIKRWHDQAYSRISEEGKSKLFVKQGISGDVLTVLMCTGRRSPAELGVTKERLYSCIAKTAVKISKRNRGNQGVVSGSMVNYTLSIFNGYIARYSKT